VTDKEKLTQIRKIEGIDVDSGLNNIAGMIAAYLRILGVFVKNWERDKYLLDSHLNSEDMEAFELTVHGYKSALANMGMLEASELSFKLEMAAKSGDREYITGNLAEYLDSVQALVDKIRPVLE